MLSYLFYQHVRCKLIFYISHMKNYLYFYVTNFLSTLLSRFHKSCTPRTLGNECNNAVTKWMTLQTFCNSAQKVSPETQTKKSALMHGTLLVGVSQSLRRWTEGTAYIRQGGHHVGRSPTFWLNYCLCCADTTDRPVHVIQWVRHSDATCDSAWRARLPLLGGSILASVR